MLSRIIVLALALAVLIAGVFTYTSIEKSDKPLPAVPSDQQATAIFTPEDWHEFSPPSKKFKVMFPSLPQHASQTVSHKEPKNLRHYDTYIAEKANGTAFMVSLITMKNSDDNKPSEESLTEVMNDTLGSNPQNKLKSMMIGSYKQHPSLNFTIENEAITIDGKAFLIGKTLYLLTMVSKNADYQKQESDYFINSFQAMEKTAEPVNGGSDE